MNHIKIKSTFIFIFDFISLSFSFEYANGEISIIYKRNLWNLNDFRMPIPFARKHKIL